VTVDPAALAGAELYRLMIGAIVPRPIAWVSTVDPAGVRNLAPFSYFMGVSAEPPVIAFAVTSRPGPLQKDTLRNIRSSKEFVVNFVTEALAEAMNLTSGEYAPEVDEFALAGLTALPGELVQAPRVAESPVQWECRLLQEIVVSEKPAGATLVLGEVVRMHVDDAVRDAKGRIDPERYRAIGRMGGSGYTRTRDRFDMIRPKA
jgi:flavin reductase (DIM6/NTAB) family NADH-FMN oxidoreductase RutF